MDLDLKTLANFECDSQIANAKVPVQFGYDFIPKGNFTFTWSGIVSTNYITYHTAHLYLDILLNLIHLWAQTEDSSLKVLCTPFLEIVRQLAKRTQFG